MRKFALILLALTFCLPAAMANPTVTSGYDPTAVTQLGARYRSFANTGGQEVYEGKPNLGTAGNRVAQDLIWSSGDNTFSFVYDASANTLTSTVNNNPALVYNIPFSPTTPVNYMQISVKDEGVSPVSKVDLTNVVLNGYALGSFDVGQSGFHDWQVTGIDLSAGFTITGNIHLEPPFNTSQEASRVEIKAGNVVPAPGAALLGFIGLSIVGWVKRRFA